MLILIRFDNTVSQCFDSSRSLSQDSCWPTDYNYIVYDLLLPDASEINLTRTRHSFSLDLVNIHVSVQKVEFTCIGLLDIKIPNKSTFSTDKCKQIHV